MKYSDLPHPDNLYLDAAEGWLGLGNLREAEGELAQINARFREHPQVLEVRYQLAAHAGQWERAVELARAVTRELPDNSWGPFHLAYSLHELKRTQEAYDTLRAVADRFPDKQLIPYNLACYSCQLGRLPEALEWLDKAGKLDGEADIRSMALEDQDLKPLWSKLGEI